MAIKGSDSIDALKKKLQDTKIGNDNGFTYPRKYQSRVHSVAISLEMTVRTRMVSKTEIEVTRTA